MQLLVKSIRDETRDIKSYELVNPTGRELKPFKAGSHLEIQLPGGYLRQYSLCNNPSEVHRYRLAVLRENEGRGGSKAFHDVVGEGDLLETTEPQNNFSLDQTGMHFTLISGGIGIVPLLSMAYKLKALRKPFAFHACAHTVESIPFREELEALVEPDQLHLYISNGDPARHLNVTQLLEKPIPAGLVYCCGPATLMDAVGEAASNWNSKNIRFELFAPKILDGSDEPFDVKIASTGQVISVDSTTTILEALRQKGVPIPFSCEVGLCRSCVTSYTGGEVEHRDQDVLSPEERKQNLAVCVSRCLSGELVLII